MYSATRKGNENKVKMPFNDFYLKKKIFLGSMNSPSVYEVISLYCFCFIICFNSYLASSMCSLCGQIPEIYLWNREKAHKDSVQ